MARAGFGGPRDVVVKGHIKGPDGRWYSEGIEISLARCFNERGGKPRMKWVHKTNNTLKWPKIKNDVVYGLNIKNGKIVAEGES